MSDKKQDTAVAIKEPDVVPAFMANDAGQGQENIKRGDIEVPRVQLLQGISPEIEAFDAAKVGRFWYSLADMDLGDRLSIVPVYYDMRYILWRPRVDGGGILARADDGVHWSPPDAEFSVKINKAGKQVTWRTAETVAASGLNQWGTFDPDETNSPPAATKMCCLVCELPDYPEFPPALITLQRSGTKAARKLLGKLSIGTAPIYGRKFIMESTNETGPEGPFKGYRFIQDGFVVDEANYARYRESYNTFKKLGLSAESIESAQEDEPLAGDAEAEDKVKF